MNTTIAQLFDLSGQVAIVTGGAMGIGKGIALRLAEAGANLLIVDIAPAKEAAPTLREIRDTGAQATYLEADLTQPASWPQVIDRALAEYGDLHILVNNAGIFQYAPVTELPESLWDRTIDLNLKAVAFLSQLAVRAMIERQHGGRIINISSVDSLKPTGNLSHYDASKGGVRMLTRAFAKEVGRHGITVNDIAPGGVDTPGVRNMSAGASAEERAAAKAQMEQFMRSLPLQRMGEPDDIGNAALFLAGKASAYMTGSTLVVDGGLLVL